MRVMCLPPVMWSETIGLRGQDRSETKKIGLGLGVVRCGLGLGLGGLVLFCENDLLTLVVIVISKDTATF